MLYHSINNSKNLVSFENAVLNGISPDGSLYIPQYIPKLNILSNKKFFDRDDNLIALSVIKPYLGKDITDNCIFNIIDNTLKFPFPIKKIHDNIYTLELFHGPTLAFKDVGAKFMAEYLNFISNKIGKKITVLVATSGDTGGAVAKAFYKKKGIEVIILYPRNGISSLQEKQISSLGHNILSLEIDGNFDNCQYIVKKSFLDKEIKKKYILTSANSINIARLLPQMFYYFISYKNIIKKIKDISELVFSVPSGNFGNICAGMMAEKMGLPIKFFIASTNINDTIPRFLSTNKYDPMVTKKTISNAMDISNPSNFPRIWNFLYKKNFIQIKKKLYSYSFTDSETLSTIIDVYNNYKYIMDPHGAIGYLGISRHSNKKLKSSCIYIFLETAHPFKFLENMPCSIRKNISKNKNIMEMLNNRKIKKISIKNNFDQFKSWLLENK
ncbi:threonine synthase [Blattabacterium cuenoti]|uniref:threonine synthase n=1 Tax=Blattabacterium cuenoti TaxID=1653831 RepID=UPI00163D0E99|nr:threonine synthase [Blattabacterium cuenoti]